MLDEKEKLLKKNRLFSIRRNRKVKTAYEKARTFYFFLSVFLCLVLIGLIYFLNDVSNVYRIAVEGNVYLKDEDIIEASGLSDRSKYLFVLPFQVEKRIERNSLIESADVRLMEGRLVRISVSEKKIVGYAPENGLNVLILADGERVGISKDNMYLITNGPIIEGFTEDELNTLAKQLGKCQRKIIKEISEIHNYPALKYQNVELIMRDGNYVFTSVYGMDILDHYFDIESSFISSERHCYYFEDISGNAYISACPWEEPEEETENKEGDQEGYEEEYYEEEYEDYEDE